MTVRLVRFILLLTVGWLVQACGDWSDPSLERGISTSLAQFRSHHISEVNYQLHFDIPLGVDSAIHAKMVLRFNLRKVKGPLPLDFNASSDHIRKIVINGEEVEVEWKEEHLILPQRHLKNKNKVEITFIAGDQSLNRNEDYLYTLFVPDRASTCFPLFDQPDLKATYDLSLTIPSEWKAVANGDMIRTLPEDGRSTWQFETSEPISSYLFSFVVGKFEVITRQISGRKVNMFHRETDTLKLSRNVDTIFAWHEESISWLEKYTEIELPFQKFDFVLIPSFQYGGMEHPGAVYYNASSLLLDESSTVNQQLGRARLIAHETAHMWFGDLVTMKWFDDVWLKEVFANLMASKIVNPGFPEINHDLQFLMAHYPSAYSVDRTQGTHPIQQPLDNLKDAGTLYGALIYHKAPVVMQMLEQSMGVRSFQAGIQQYLRHYAYKNANWDDLIRIMSSKGNLDLEKWNERWVKSAGMPTVHYNLRQRHGKEDTLESFEIWFGDERGKRQWWNQDLKILYGYDAHEEILEANLLSEDILPDLQGKPYPDYLFTNAGGLGYGFFRMGKNSTSHFLKSIDAYQDPVLRGALWINLYESMLRGRLSQEQLMSRALESLPTEEEPLLAEYIVEVIQTIYWRFYSEEARVKLAPRLEGLFLNMMLHASSKSLKSTYFKALQATAISENGVMVLKKIWREEMEVDGLPLSEQDFTGLAYQLAVRGVSDYKEILNTQLERITNPDRKRKFKFIEPALSSDQEDRDEFFNSLKEEKNRHNEAWVLEALRYLHHPLRTASSIKYITPSLELLPEIQQTGDIFFPKRWLDNTLQGHSSHEADQEVRQFLYRHHNIPPNLKNKILQAADMLFRCVELKSPVESED